MSDLAQIRWTKQIAADHWVTACKVCPKRAGRMHGQTQFEVDRKWADHVSSAAHRRCAGGDGEPTPEELLLHEIFGSEPHRSLYAPKDRAGEVVVRPSVGRKFRDVDNPHGDTPNREVVVKPDFRP